jgi:hypothetical protein
MGTTIPAGYVEVRKGVYERRDLIKKGEVGRKTFSNNQGASGNPKPKRPILNEPLAKGNGKKENTGRIHIRLTARRKRLIDPDNLIFKYHIDCLRYAGAIPDDREGDVTIETHQEKTRGQEETLIELFRHDAA